MEPFRAQIREVAEEVWASTLELQVVPAADIAWPPEDGRWVEAHLDIHGAWCGRVVLQCSTAFARLVAAKMFHASPAEVSPADVVDAVGELANMLGGNVKALLPGPSLLSLPSVAEQQDGSEAHTDGVVVSDSFFDSADEQIRISVFKSEPPKAGDPAGPTRP
jgi:chemotaxis protein CheX